MKYFLLCFPFLSACAHMPEPPESVPELAGMRPLKEAIYTTSANFVKCIRLSSVERKDIGPVKFSGKIYFQNQDLVKVLSFESKQEKNANLKTDKIVSDCIEMTKASFSQTVSEKFRDETKFLGIRFGDLDGTDTEFHFSLAITPEFDLELYDKNKRVYWSEGKESAFYPDYQAYLAYKAGKLPWEAERKNEIALEVSSLTYDVASYAIKITHKISDNLFIGPLGYFLDTCFGKTRGTPGGACNRLGGYGIHGQYRWDLEEYYNRKTWYFVEGSFRSLTNRYLYYDNSLKLYEGDYHPDILRFSVGWAMLNRSRVTLGFHVGGYYILNRPDKVNVAAADGSTVVVGPGPNSDYLGEMYFGYRF